MQELKKTKIIKHIKIATSIRCDWCQKKYVDIDGAVTFPGGSVETTFGYGSEYDGDKVSLDICDRCFEKYIKPKIKKYGEYPCEYHTNDIVIKEEKKTCQ